MNHIISTSQIPKLTSTFKKGGQRIVLVGGCFDVLHPGHVIFLQKAKKAGDILVILLESDEKVKQLKGANRPVHNQKMRAKVLASLTSVDLVVKLPFMEEDDQYDQLILKIKPDVIAATSGYPNINYHKRAADLVGVKLIYVTKIIGNHSTSKILSHSQGL